MLKGGGIYFPCAMASWDGSREWGFLLDFPQKLFILSDFYTRWALCVCLIVVIQDSSKPCSEPTWLIIDLFWN